MVRNRITGLDKENKMLRCTGCGIKMPQTAIRAESATCGKCCAKKDALISYVKNAIKIVPTNCLDKELSWERIAEAAIRAVRKFDENAGD